MDQDIRSRDQIHHERQITRVLQVSNYGFLVAVHGVERHRVAITPAATKCERASNLSREGTLDLHDPGTEVGQSQRSYRTGEKLTEVENEHAVKG